MTASDLEAGKRLDALKHLRDAAWRDFDTRRAFEWKIALSLWTALAAFAASILTGRISTSTCTVLPAAVGFGVAIVVLHCWFVAGIARATRINRTKEFFFEAEMLVVLILQLPSDLQSQIDRAKEDLGQLWHWSHGFQIGITALLVISSICVIAVAGH